MYFSQEFGDFPLLTTGERACRSSLHTGWHIKRQTGILSVNIGLRFIFHFLLDYFVNMPYHSVLRSNCPLFIRATLIRVDPAFRNMPLGRVCDRHQIEVEPLLRSHIIHPAIKEHERRYHYASSPRYSVCLFVLWVVLFLSIL